MTIDDARARVARGAALLDEKRPGWAQQINTRELDMASGCFCILGQLEESYTAAIRRLWPLDLACRVLQTRIHGFDVNPASDKFGDYRILQDAWIAAIADRVVKAETPEPAMVCV